MDKYESNLNLPGFRFKPTEEELLSFYLKNKIHEKKTQFIDIIGFLNIYHHDPWDLPGLATIGEREWYFYVPRDRKHSNGGKPNRTTEHGFWKATGSDRKIVSLSEPKRVIGLRKTLVFYKGRAPRGSKTDWVMNEYRLPDNYVLHKDIVLCKVYRKATSLKELEQRAAKEEAQLDESKLIFSSYPTSPFSPSNETTIFNDDFSQFQDLFEPLIMPNNDHIMSLKKEEVEEKFDNDIVMSNNDIIDTRVYKTDRVQVRSCNPIDSNNTIQLPFGKDCLQQLQIPTNLGLDWAEDPIFSQCSPWIENLFNFSSPTIISQFLST